MKEKVLCFLGRRSSSRTGARLDLDRSQPPHRQRTPGTETTEVRGSRSEPNKGCSWTAKPTRTPTDSFTHRPPTTNRRSPSDSDLDDPGACPRKPADSHVAPDHADTATQRLQTGTGGRWPAPSTLLIPFPPCTAVRRTAELPNGDHRASSVRTRPLFAHASLFLPAVLVAALEDNKQMRK